MSVIAGDVAVDMSPENLSKLKKDDLKNACRGRGLPVSGNKSELISRLQAFSRSPSPKRNIRGPKKMAQNGKNSGATTSKKRSRSLSVAAREKLKKEREEIVLWKKPFTTIHYCLRELALSVFEWLQQLFSRKLPLLLGITLVGGTYFMYHIDGPHQKHIQGLEKYLVWYLWWIGLGVLSSVGLGTGLHTFLLYLGPHIAAVTLASYECGTTDFPEPPYPDSIVCPEGTDGDKLGPMTIWKILSKVQIEAFCWGAGTALGELPPYFMARAHRLSGYDSDEEDDEFDELQEKMSRPEDLNLFDRAKIGVERLVERVGFFGILACASIPNPLFDLAGITCGHFLVPFWTFFGATLIGKAIIKMHIQKFFVIFAFNENLINTAVAYISKVPAVGPKLEGPIRELLIQQKQKLHRKKSDVPETSENPNILSWIFEKFVILMIFYFVLSIVNSLAQSYHKRIHKRKHAVKEEAEKLD